MPRAEKITINPDRVIWCCAEVGEEHYGVLKKAGISASSVPEQVTYRQLQIIADYFERSIFFFMEATEPSEESEYSPRFRNLVKPKKLGRKAQNLIRRIEKHRQIYIDLLRELEETAIPKLRRYDDFDISVREIQDILWNDEKIAKKKKIKFNDYRQIVERLGIFVVVSNSYPGKWYLKDLKDETPFIGLSLNFEDFPIIFVKSESSKKRQVFTLMHELGHLLLHKADKIDGHADIHGVRNEFKQEREANRFAARVLVPDFAVEEAFACIKNDINNVSSYYEMLRKMSDRFQVSVEAIVLSLVDAKKIEKKMYDEYRILQGEINKDINQMKKKTGGVARDRRRETRTVFGEKYVETVLTAYNEELITLSKASGYLGNIKVKDVLALNS